MTIALNHRTTTRVLATIIAVLLLAQLAGRFSAIVLGRDTVHGLIPLLNMDEERNLPTFYSALAILTLLIGALSLRFVLRLPPTVRNLFLLAGGLFVAGALGLELVGGMMVRDPHNMGRVLVNALEEVLEMAGIVILIRGLVMSMEMLGISVDVGGRPDRTEAS